ncbi:MAG: WD40 repeat domain-containing protein [Planctomycetota bacterium]
MITRLSILQVGAALLLVVAGASASGERPTGALAGFANSREWSDASGRFKITGELFEATSDTVKIKKGDSRVVTVPRDKLAEADQSFISAFMAAASAVPGGSSSAADPDNPFAGGEMVDANPSPSPSPAASTNLLDGIPMHEMRDDADSVSIDFGASFWNGKPVSAREVSDTKNRSFDLPLAKEFFASVNMMIAGSTPRAFFSVYKDGDMGAAYTKLGRFDIEARKAIPLATGSKPWKIMAVSRDASLLALVRIEGFDKGNDIALLKVSEDGARPLFQFKAGGGSWAEVRYASFLANDRLLTIDQKHNLVVWNLRDRKSIYKGNLSSRVMDATIGGNGELIAIAGDGVVALLNGKTLEQVGTLSVEGGSKPTIAFSNDGQSIATYSPFAIEIFSLDDGQRTQRITVPNRNPGASLDFVGDDLFLGGNLLVDTRKERPWWNYQIGRGPKAVFGSTVYRLFAGENQSKLTAAQIPHDAALRAIDLADQADLYAIRPGSPVELSVNLSGLSGTEVADIKVAVEQKILENGWSLVSSSPNRIELSLVQGQTKTQEYVESRGFGPPIPFGPQPSGPKTKVSYRPWVHTISVKVGEKVVYNSKSSTVAPSYIPNAKGKSTQQQVNEYMKPSTAFFKEARIPSEIVKPEYQNGFGTSRMTEAGLQ